MTNRGTSRMIPRLTANWIGALVGAILAGGLGWFLQSFPAGSSLVNASYDLLLVARGDLSVEGAVLVYLDEESFEQLEQPLNRPWSRQLHARLIERLTRAGAKAIVMDIVFSDPDLVDPAVDRVLAEAMRKSGRVILAADYVPAGPKMKRAIPPIDLFLDSMAGMGSAEVVPARDLVVRQHTPESPEDPISPLSWATAEFLKARVAGDPAGKYVPRWLNYYGPANYLPWVSYFQALDPARVPDSDFRDKIVVVGARIITKFAGERKDEYRNPFATWSSGRIAQGSGTTIFISGAEIQATSILNLVRGDWLLRLRSGIERWWIVLIGLLFGFGLVQFRPLLAALIGLAGLILAGVVSYLVFRWTRVWFPWLIVDAALGVALVWAITFNSIQLYIQKRLQEQTLKLYLPPKLVKKFSRDPKLLKPGAEKTLLTILFSDIANFTTLSEGMDSDELAKLMNNYFENAVSRCIHKTDGTVVKYIGDAIFAFWNAPEEQSDHALRACLAALSFRDQEVQIVRGRPLVTRIGLHTGVANVGNFGSTERVDYTALGESINLASRMEGLNKHLGTALLITGDTKNRIGDQLVTRFLGRFQLKGFEKATDVHELVGPPDQAEPTRPWREAFARAHQLLAARQFDAAEAAFRGLLEIRPEDGPSRFYLARLSELRAGPLAPGWAGEIELKEK